MKFLLFFLGISFYFIFFLFSQNSEIQGSFFPNLFLEAHLYIVLSFLCIGSLYFSFSNKKQEAEEMENRKTTAFFQKEKLLPFLKTFFSQYIYFIALFCFYISLFFIFRELLGEIHIPRIFLFFNILVLFLLSLEHKSEIFQDILRVNTALISFYYIIFHILYLFGYIDLFKREDMVNILFLGLLFFLFFRSQKAKKYLGIFQTYALSFFFLELCVFSKYVFSDFSLIFGGGSFFFSLIFLIYTEKIKRIFHISLPLIRVWGLIFSYIFIGFVSWQIWIEASGVTFFVGCMASTIILLYFFHNRFQNYISLFWSFLGAFVFSYFFFTLLFSERQGEFIGIFFLICSWIILFFDVSQKQKYVYDTYFFHTISLIVNLFGAIGFFFFVDFSILNGAILLAGESVYFFFSYYSLQKKLSLGYTID